MKKYPHGPPGRITSFFKNGRGDPYDWITDLFRARVAHSGFERNVWLTCQNWVCQDFLFLNVTF